MSGIIKSIVVVLVTITAVNFGFSTNTYSNTAAQECFLLGHKYVSSVEKNGFYTIDESFDKSHPFKGHDSRVFPTMNRRTCLQFEMVSPGATDLNITASAQFRNRFTKQGKVEPLLSVYVVPKDRLSYGPDRRPSLDLAGLKNSLCGQSKPTSQRGNREIGITAACKGQLGANKPTLVILFLGSGVDNYIEPTSLRMRLDVLAGGRK